MLGQGAGACSGAVSWSRSNIGAGLIKVAGVARTELQGLGGGSQSQLTRYLTSIVLD